MSNNCYLSEIYSAIQGEGPHVGVRQIFIRFSGCDLRCIWCDTPESLVRTESCEVEVPPGKRTFQKLQNPISSLQLISTINNFNPSNHHSISLTGGEPLLQADFLYTFLPELKKKFSIPIYLESGGHRPLELKKIIKFLDYVSMDFKLPSSAKTGTLWEKHKEYLDVCLLAENLKDFWIKIVITSNTEFDDLISSVNLIKVIKEVSNSNKKIEVFLQPVSKINNIFPPNENDLLNIQSRLLEFYPHIRVLPQVHKLIGQR